MLFRSGLGALDALARITRTSLEQARAQLAARLGVEEGEMTLSLSPTAFTPNSPAWQRAEDIKNANDSRRGSESK